MTLLTGNLDCVAELVYTSSEHLLRLMMDRLPGLDGVVVMSSVQVLRRFSTPHGWSPPILPQAVVAALHAERIDHWRERTFPNEGLRLSKLDERLIELLSDDGRLGWQEVGQHCGVMASTVRRHVEALMTRGFCGCVRLWSPR